MTLQHEIVSKLADRIVSESAGVAGRPVVTIDGGTPRLHPTTAAGLCRINRAWKEAEALGVGSAVIAEIKRRGFVAAATQAAE